MKIDGGMQTMRRVVITGLGVVAPNGNDVESAWTGTVEGRSGIDRISLFDPTPHRVQIAGEIKDLQVRHCLSEAEDRSLTRFVRFAAVAAHEALHDSGLTSIINPERYGCIIGVGMGSVNDIAQQSFKGADGLPTLPENFLPFALQNMAAGYVADRYGWRGPCYCKTTACASGTHAIGEAFRLIREGSVDAMLAGGAEGGITPLGIASFAALRALSMSNQNPKEASRPFDRDRDGFVMGEGAGMLVLEDYEHARRRGARIYAELAGYGLSGDGFHITSPQERGAGGRRCMQMALQSGRIASDEVDYINAHGTSTRMNDQYESEAILDLFGEHAQNVSVSSTKGVTGHCMGAAGAIEAVFTTLAVHQQLIPPTINYKEPDPLCPLDYTPNNARRRKVRVALSNSFGFGGTNASIAIRQIS
jgi:3-oxoacyl-[acyl-carrier-protein] synthase II